MFGLGDEVVCINDDEPPQHESGPFVIKGRHYTVAGINVFVNVDTGQIAQTIFVEELPAPAGIGWYAFRFRKVEKTGTQIVDEMINKLKISEKV